MKTILEELFGHKYTHLTQEEYKEMFPSQEEFDAQIEALPQSVKDSFKSPEYLEVIRLGRQILKGYQIPIVQPDDDDDDYYYDY